MAREIHEARPVDFLTNGALVAPDGSAELAALIILNQPIADIELLSQLWANTNYRVCADGGANRLYELFVDTNAESRKRYVNGSQPMVGKHSS